MYFFLVKRYVDRYASCYLEPGFSYLWNSVCVGLMVVTWMPTWYVIWEFFILFKCIFKLGPRAGNMLQGPRYLNPALVVLVTTHRSSLLCKKAQWHWHTPCTVNAGFPCHCDATATIYWEPSWKVRNTGYLNALWVMMQAWAHLPLGWKGSLGPRFEVPPNFWE